jgi:hypothetical protein
MTHEEKHGPGARDAMGRRRLLARLGATGLAASMGVFASRTPARASTAAMCCDLTNFPPNATYDYCHKRAGYIWYCSLSEYLHCSCCETEGERYSAAECRTNSGKVL